MSSGKMWLVALALGLMPIDAPAWAEVLVLTDGQRIQTQGPWTVKGRQVIFHTPEGTLTMLRASEVDLEASRKASSGEEQPKAEESKPAPVPPPPTVQITNSDLRPIWQGVSRYLILKQYDLRQRYRAGAGPPIIVAAELDHALSWLLAIADKYPELDLWPKQVEQMTKLADPLRAFSSEIETRLDQELSGQAKKLAESVAMRADYLAQHAENNPEAALVNLGDFDKLRERFGDSP